MNHSGESAAKERTTLLFYINTINGGGAARVLIQVAHHFAMAGYRSVLITSFVATEHEYAIPPDVIRRSLEEEQIQQSRIKRNLSRIQKLRRICKEEKPAAIISFMAEPNFRSVVAVTGLGIKRIISIRNDPAREYRGMLGMITGKVLLPQADGCIFQTEAAKKWFPKRLQRKSSVILNDVKEEFFALQHSGGRDIVTVGRLDSQKNHALLIHAFASIADKYPDRRLLIYGDGELKDATLCLIDSLQMKERIKLMGTTKDVASVLQNAALFVLSSDYEGMPNCLMEALAAGVPCISTDCPCGGPGALIRDGENGLLVQVQDKDAMTKAIDRLLSDPDYAERIGQEARIRAAQFHPDRIFPQWKSYVEEVIHPNS